MTKCIFMEHFHHFPHENVVKKVAIVLATGACLHLAVKAYKKYTRNQQRKQYKKDVVILHQFERSTVAPSLSPYAMKLETYLRMAKIPYENDMKEPFGPKGKCPWITYNGEDVADSTLCIEYLNKKLSINLDSQLSPSTKAVNRLLVIAAEEHFMWSLAVYRYVFDEKVESLSFFKMPFYASVMLPILYPLFKRRMLKYASYQGIGRHSREEIIEMGIKDLRAMSTILGDKPYFGGDKPSEVDCGMFGTLGQVVWHSPSSPYAELFNGELKNLKNFCFRMKQEFWPDWDQIIAK